jgi:hypothetical protein
MSDELTLYDAARTALANARNVDEVKSIRDRAVVLRAYARQAKDRGLELDAAEIRLRAERRLGEIIAAQKALPREKGGGMNRGERGQLKGRDSSGGAKREPPENPTPTLDELGIDKKLSSRSQKLAAVPEAKFDKEVADWRGRVEDGTERAASDMARVMERQPKAAPAKRTKRPHGEMASDVAWGELWAWRNRNGNLAIFRAVFDAVDGLRKQFMGGGEE